MFDCLQLTLTVGGRSCRSVLFLLFHVLTGPREVFIVMDSANLAKRFLRTERNVLTESRETSLNLRSLLLDRSSDNTNGKGVS